jgi:hypothetical protein
MTKKQRSQIVDEVVRRFNRNQYVYDKVTEDLACLITDVLVEKDLEDNNDSVRDSLEVVVEVRRKGEPA